MKNNLNVKLLDLKVVPTTLDKSKKVMVSCEINGKISHYYIFLNKKAEYKDEDYIKEAKKQLDDDIKNGVIKKKVATTTFKHPFVLATFGVVGAIALTMTGLFAWKAITNGGGTPEPQPEPTPTEEGDPSKPLTFTALQDRGKIEFTYINYNNSSTSIIPTRSIELEYRVDDGNWTKVNGIHQIESDSYTITIVDEVKRGQQISFRGDNKYWSFVPEDSIGQQMPDCYESLTLFTVGKFSAENNIMSLLHKENFENATDLSVGCFFRAFALSNTRSDLYDASKLVLPKTERLPAFCYYGMFQNCNLIYAPHEFIYKYIDYGACYWTFYQSLVVVGPKQVGEEGGTIAEDGCRMMFYECSHLQSAPTLPASILKDGCYAHMFFKCSAMVGAPSQISDENGTIGEYSCLMMFYSCTEMRVAPNLPTVILSKHSYDSMFINCLNLSILKVGFSTWPTAEGVTTDWLKTDTTYADIRTFYWQGESGRGSVTEDDSHVPSGWTIYHID